MVPTVRLSLTREFRHYKLADERATKEVKITLLRVAHILLLHPIFREHVIYVYTKELVVRFIDFE